MDLYIRSQDKENTVKIINQYGLKYNDKKTIIANYQPDFTDKYDGYYEILGTYATKERALEVLDEMQEFIENRDTVKITQDIHEITSEVEIAKKVYNMPKE